MIRCTKCQELKPFDHFRKAKLGRYGRESRCKPCRSKQRREYSLANPEKRQESRQRYYIKTRNSLRAKHKIYNQLLI